ncbi:hypothetical protein IQ07DRAFT_385619 [Pyrenochaeta sp. DS3sAY3a]|nr:hypothetical protein IQ07DRAFT_385619 [Pyrenochaeta sp. DS3sAY3a]
MTIPAEHVSYLHFRFELSHCSQPYPRLDGVFARESASNFGRPIFMIGRDTCNSTKTAKRWTLVSTLSSIMLSTNFSTTSENAVSGSKHQPPQKLGVMGIQCSFGVTGEAFKPGVTVHSRNDTLMKATRWGLSMLILPVSLGTPSFCPIMGNEGIS